MRRISSSDLQVDFADQNFFFVVRGLGDHAAERIAEERPSPELQPRSRSRVAADVAIFVADAVDGGDEDAVGDGVGALDRSQASCWAAPNSSFSAGCQPMAVG